MFIAMNRFKVAAGSEEAFENVWKNRDSSLSQVPGFIEFNLLRGKENTEEGVARKNTWRDAQDQVAAEFRKHDALAFTSFAN